MVFTDVRSARWRENTRQSDAMDTRKLNTTEVRCVIVLTTTLRVHAFTDNSYIYFGDRISGGRMIWSLLVGGGWRLTHLSLCSVA